MKIDLLTLVLALIGFLFDLALFDLFYGEKDDKKDDKKDE